MKDFESRIFSAKPAIPVERPRRRAVPQVPSPLPERKPKIEPERPTTPVITPREPALPVRR